MPNMHGVKHEVKYSNGTFEIPMLEGKETVEMKTSQELGLPHTAVYFKIVHDSI